MKNVINLDTVKMQGLYYANKENSPVKKIPDSSYIKILEKYNELLGDNKRNGHKEIKK